MQAHITPLASHAIPIKIGFTRERDGHCQGGRISLVGDNGIRSEVQGGAGGIQQYIHCSKKGRYTPSVYQPKTFQSLSEVYPFQNGRTSHSAGPDRGGRLDVRGRYHESISACSPLTPTATVLPVHLERQTLSVQGSVFWSGPGPSAVHKDVATSGATASVRGDSLRSFHRQHFDSEQVSGSECERYAARRGFIAQPRLCNFTKIDVSPGAVRGRVFGFSAEQPRLLVESARAENSRSAFKGTALGAVPCEPAQSLCSVSSIPVGEATSLVRRIFCGKALHSQSAKIEVGRPSQRGGRLRVVDVCVRRGGPRHEVLGQAPGRVERPSNVSRNPGPSDRDRCVPL